MLRFYKKILLSATLGFICVCYITGGWSQDTHHNIECEKASLGIYTDSLWLLMVNYQPKPVIAIADSLIEAHDDLICPDLIRVKSLRAYAYERLFQFEKAIEIYNDLLKTVTKHQFIGEEINIKISLARSYETIGRPELSLQNLKEVDQLFEPYQDEYQLSHHYLRYSSYHRIYDSRDSARVYARKAIEYGEKSGRIGSIAGGYMVMIGLTDNREEKLDYINKCAHYCYEEGDIVCFLIQKLNLASMHVEENNHSSAFEILDNIKDGIEDLIDNEKNYYRIKMYEAGIKARAFEIAGQNDSLITSLREVNKFSQLFGNVTNQEKINELIINNAIEQEQAKVKLAKKRTRVFAIALITMFVVLLLFLWLYFQNQKKKKKIEEQRTTISSQLAELRKLYNYQTTLLSEVHHRIKNNLQLIISLLTLQKAKLGGDLQDGILDMLSCRISSISLIHEQLYNLKEFEKVDVGLYVRDLIKNFKGLTFGRDVQIEHSTDDIYINLETIIPLGLIWSELISNSLKYNSAIERLKIYFELKENGNEFEMNYYDNGVGYPEGQFRDNNTGMGFTIINSLTRQLSGESSTFNKEGAHFTLKFKQKTISPL